MSRRLGQITVQRTFTVSPRPRPVTLEEGEATIHRATKSHGPEGDPSRPYSKTVWFREKDASLKQQTAHTPGQSKTPR